MDIINILNTIRANATSAYQTQVPVATATNIEAVGNPIISYTALGNEMLSALVNKICMTKVSNMVIKNPLAILKKGNVPLGTDIEDIFTNPSMGKTFDGKSTDLLTVVTPDTKVAYYRMNRKDKFPVTVSTEMLMKAFTSYANFELLVSSIINSLYSGDNYAEFLLMKQLMIDAIKGGLVKTHSVTQVTDKTTAESFIKAVQTDSTLMGLPSTTFNSYAQVNTADTKPVITWTPKEKQVFIVDAGILANVNVDVLATAFNMDKASFMARTIPIDTFGATVGVHGMLCDEAWFQVYDNLQKMETFHNGDNLTDKYIWHHWQTYSAGLFCNAVAFNFETIVPEA